ncbi:MAG TPA: Maf family protein [Pseudogracilibacillus sp.]|nr:Maf family protein [Pseudogracilibacillus sp.]
MKDLILGSTSPRRQALLKQLNIPFTIKQPNFDETSVTLKDPLKKVERLAKEKADSIVLPADNALILAADTVVAFEHNIFEKPADKDDAYKMISTLSGQTHDVITAVALRSSESNHVFSVKTEVTFWNISEAEIKSYIATAEPYDKAGAYGIQGTASLFVKEIQGDYFNVVGLPISHVVRALRQLNFPVDRYLFSKEKY